MVWKKWIVRLLHTRALPQKAQIVAERAEAQRGRDSREPVQPADLEIKLV